MIFLKKLCTLLLRLHGGCTKILFTHDMFSTQGVSLTKDNKDEEGEELVDYEDSLEKEN
jgi:hypothetical protein